MSLEVNSSFTEDMVLVNRALVWTFRRILSVVAPPRVTVSDQLPRKRGLSFDSVKVLTTDDAS